VARRAGANRQRSARHFSQRQSGEQTRREAGKSAGRCLQRLRQTSWNSAFFTGEAQKFTAPLTDRFSIRHQQNPNDILELTHDITRHARPQLSRHTSLNGSSIVRQRSAPRDTSIPIATAPRDPSAIRLQASRFPLPRHSPCQKIAPALLSSVATLVAAFHKFDRRATPARSAATFIFAAPPPAPASYQSARPQHRLPIADPQ